MNIDLTNPNDLPEEFVTRLRGIENLCHEFEFSESLVECSWVSDLVNDIDEYCKTQKVVGIHYSRAIPESIRKNGLLIRNGDDIRAAFLKDHGHLLTETEIATIKEKWASYYVTDQCTARDGRVSFKFTESALNTSGTEYLLSLYGGEQISMCFELNEPIAQKLGGIGVPLVVRCALDPRVVRTRIECPWGKILVSAYHLMVNPGACVIDQDGYQSIPVKPEDIIEIMVLTKKHTDTEKLRQFF